MKKNNQNIINRWVKEGLTIDPYYIVGLTDAEATFTISISKDNRVRKTTRGSIDVIKREIYSVQTSFAISLNVKDSKLIYSLQSFFGVGNVKQDLSNNAITYYVNSASDLLKVIIPFFDHYPLITQKRADFILFKSAVKLITAGVHLTHEGLIKIVSIKASMNKGLSEKLITNFPGIVPADRPLVSLEDESIKDNNWLTGFVDGEGSFYVRIMEATTAKSVNRVSFFFSISQAIREKVLLSQVSKYLDCGTISGNAKYIQFRVTKLGDIESKIIPFFKKYPMHGIKNLNFEDFCTIFDLVQTKAHLTSEGLDKIKKINGGMNLRRE